MKTANNQLDHTTGTEGDYACRLTGYASLFISLLVSLAITSSSSVGIT